MKHTPSGHLDYENLTKALESVKQTADALNECKRLTDKVSQIEETLVGEFEVLNRSMRSLSL